MGSCISAIFTGSNRENVENVQKMDKNVEKDEVEPTHVVAVHVNSTSSTVSFQSQLKLSVRELCESVDFDADDELSSDTSSFQTEGECDFVHPHEETLDKSSLPRNTNRTVQSHGLGQQNTQSRLLAPMEKPASSSSENKRFVRDVNVCDGSKTWVKQRFGSRSKTKPKKREQLAKEKSKRKPRRFLGRKRVVQEEEMYANKVRLVKKIIKNVIKTEVDHEPKNGSPVLPPDERIARMFGVEVEDIRDCGASDGSSSDRPASTRPSTANSWDWDSSSLSDISTTLDEDSENPSVGSDHEMVKTKPSSAKTEHMAAIPRPSTVTPWYSSTASEEDLERPRARRPCKRVKSTLVRVRNWSQMGARTPSSTNSWGSSTTSDKESEESSSSSLQKDVQLMTEDLKKERGSTFSSPSASSGSSWDSSSNSDEDRDQASMQSTESTQKDSRSRKWFRLKNNKVAPQ